jgi:hypothetical protein
VRKALIVGIDHYEHISTLRGCVNDAHSVKATLDRHADGSVNFGTRIMTSTGPSSLVTREEIRDAVQQLFADDNDVALFYFAGHGHLETTGGYLCGSDCRAGHDGLSLHEIMAFASASKARNKIILLDSCHSGVAGENVHAQRLSEISEGITILTASTKEQYATELNGAGLFTSLFIDALSGAAANLVGDVTPGSVYAHIDQSLGTWSQRPVFKTNVKKFVSLRRVDPPVPLVELRRIVEFFPSAGFEFPVDPSFEPEHASADAGNTAIFAILQKYNRVNLVVPVDAPHMWHAATQSKTVKLTALGEHYRRLAAESLI